MGRFLQLAGLPLHSSPFSGLTEALREGMQTGATPQKLRDEAQQRELAISQSKQTLEHPGLKSTNPMVQLAAMLKLESGKRGTGSQVTQAETSDLVSSLGGDLGGEAAPVESSDGGFVNPYQPMVDEAGRLYGKDSSLFKALEAEARKESVNLQRKEQIVDFQSDLAGSQTAKLEKEAILRGAGIPAWQYYEGVDNGRNMKEQLADAGYSKDDMKKLKKLHAPGSGTIENLVQARGNEAAAGVLHEAVKAGIGPNVRTVNGYSINHLKNQLSGMNEDQQGQYIGALALGTDQAGLQLKMAGASGTHASMLDLSESLMSNAKISKILTSQAVYEKGMNYVHQALKDMNRARTDAILGQGNYSSQQEPGERGIESFSIEELISMRGGS